MTKTALNDGPESGTRTRNAVVRVGRVVEITADGEVWVQFGNEPKQLAWTAENVPLGALQAAARENTPVVAQFPEDMQVPVITCVLRERRASDETAPPPAVHIQAMDFVVIEVGGAVLRLDKSGKFTINGSEVEISADGKFTLKGATIRLN